jgi:NAD(P)-dependent dehydrogenase (short-subunit alcohol dehydrogenase family)
MDFSGKRVLITGGARGIGLAIARRFSSMGADTIITDYDAAGGQKALEELTSAGYKASFIKADDNRLSTCLIRLRPAESWMYWSTTPESSMISS